MSRDITLLHPELQAIIKSFLAGCQKAGLPVLVVETLRTAAEQDALYAQGRTKPGAIVTQCKGSDFSSCHQWGIAFDFCRNVKGAEYSDADGFFGKAAAVGKTMGLDWGGDWTGFTDKPHLQMRKFSPDGTANTLKANYKTPEAFFKTWSGGAASNNLNPTAGDGADEGAGTLTTMKIYTDGKRWEIPSILKDGLNYPNLRALMAVLKYDVTYNDADKFITLEKI